MAPPDRDTYTSRVNKYLMDVPLPADILMIIAEYASTLVFFMGDIMAQLSCVMPPRSLPLTCPKEFVDHIRILATIRIFGEYYDQLSDYTWRKRFDTVEFWEPSFGDSIWYHYKLSQYPEDGCYSILDNDVHPDRMPKIMHIHDCEDTYLIEKLKLRLDVF